MLFSIMAAPFCIPTSSAEIGGLQFLHVLAHWKRVSRSKLWGMSSVAGDEEHSKVKQVWEPVGMFLSHRTPELLTPL